MQKLDLTGQTFGRLTVISPAQNKGKKTAWLCLCSCGNEKIIRTSALTRGLTKSCGCINHDNLLNRNIKHNLSHFRIYRIWECIKTRCINQNTNYYKHYGKRGIKLCDAWLNFENFKNWAFSNGYSEGLTIDRIDVNGNYEPSNCRWVTPKTQARNRRNNHLLTYNGITLCLTEWSEKLGISYSALESRILRGWSIEKALFTPIRSRNK